MNINKVHNSYDSLIYESTEFSRRLVSFQANKSEPFQRWFPYKEGFSKQMVSIILSKSKDKKNLIDPFAGVGTALFAAAEHNIAATGIELLPLGRVVFEAIITARTIDLELFRRSISKVDETILPPGGISDRYRFHHIKITERAFPIANETDLNSYLAKLEYADIDPKSRTLLRFAVMASLERMSYTRKDGQFLRWDSRSGKTRGTFQKPRIYTFKEALDYQLQIMIQDMYKQKAGLVTDIQAQPTFIQGSALRILPTFEDESYDIVITSPPYSNRYDYTRTYALELAFLGVDETGIRKLRQELLSNTVENKDKNQMLENIYDESGRGEFFGRSNERFENNVLLQEILSKLDNKMQHNELNNPGIFSLVKNYFFEHAFIIGELSRILKSGGEIYYVNDNVRYAGIEIPVDFILTYFAEASGLSAKRIYKLQQTKGNSSQQMKMHGKVDLRKCVYYWVKE